MASSKKQKKQKSKARPARSSESAPAESKLLRRPRRPHERPHVMIAMTLASLVTGLLFVINCDRTIHSASAAQKGHGASLHGWPLIYLERQFDSLPDFLANRQPYDWPLPAVAGEVRTMNYQNLTIDVICGVLIVLLSFLVIRHVVFRYERWKASW